MGVTTADLNADQAANELAHAESAVAVVESGAQVEKILSVAAPRHSEAA